MPTRTAKTRRGRTPVTEAKSTLDHDGLDRNLGYQLRMAYVAVRRQFERAMQRLDLTQKQTSVLWLIDANGGVSQIALATELGMDRASMMAIVDRLEDRKLIVRKRSTEDGRRQELYVTPKGKKTLSQAKTAIAGHERAMAKLFSARELAALTVALQILCS